jgi:hypothetical protein
MSCIMSHRKIRMYETNLILNKNYSQDITFSWKMSSNFSEDRNDFYQYITEQSQAALKNNCTSFLNYDSLF